MPVKIRIPTALKKFSDNKEYITVSYGKVSSILKNIQTKYPRLYNKIFDDEWKLKGYIILYLDEKDKKDVVNEDTIVSDGKKLRIILAISGG